MYRKSTHLSKRSHIMPFDLKGNVPENFITVLGAITSSDGSRLESPILYCRQLRNQPPVLYIQYPDSNLQFWIDPEGDEIVVIEKPHGFFQESSFVQLSKWKGIWVFRKGVPYEHVEGYITSSSISGAGDVVNGKELFEWLIEYRKNNPL